MDVRQLTALVAIADHGTFSAAAKALFTVQSNVSNHVARLEKELGTTLVDRVNGGLTEAGVRVVERARRVLRELDDIAADLAQRDGNIVGDVRLGMLGTTARWVLPRLLADAAVRYPDVRPIVAEGSTSVLLPALLSGQYHAAILHLPVDAPELRIEPLFAEELMLLTGPDHPLGQRSEISLADLADQRLLIPPPGAALRRVLDRARRFHAVRVPELPPRVVALAHHRRPPPSAAANALFEVLRDCLPDLALQQHGVRLGSAAFPLLR